MSGGPQQTFTCSLCGQAAGVIELRDSAAPPAVRRESFTSTLECRLATAAVARLRTALANADARSLYAVDPELAPFYCPDCDASYCGDHWHRWDVFDDEDPAWHDSIRGRCPRGHERMLED